MIENQPRRSVEFFKSPVLAGQAALARPFDTSQIIGLHGLRAIILALLQYFFAPRLQFQTENTALNADEALLMDAMQSWVNIYYSSPILIALVIFAVTLLFTTLLWQVGRVISASELRWHEAQSAFLRFLYVSMAVYAVCALSFGLTGLPLIATLANIAMIYIYVLFFFVLKGILGLRSAWQSLLVVILAIMGMLGAVWLLSLFMSFLV